MRQVVRNESRCELARGLPIPSAPQTQSLPNPSPNNSPTVSALEVVDLSRDFKTGFLRKKQRGIAGISFAVRPGIIFALLGHNGAGKTTTINCILDLVHAETGRVRIFGTSNTETSARAMVGYLPERPYFFEHLSGRELLKFYADLLGLPAQGRDAEISRILTQVGLEGAADRRLRKYSKGMLQRVGLGQALLGNPKLLILDEPMSGLDPVGRRQVRELLMKLRSEGKTIILSSHIVPDIEMLADEVAILKQGHLVEYKRMTELNRTALYEIQVVPPANYDPQLFENHIVSGKGDTVCVQVEGVEELGNLLSEFAERGWKVLGVETRCSGLEELFMKTLAAKEEEA